MAKICVTEQSARRQRWIEGGLQELMRTKRFEQITVTDLCAHLNLSRRSFYRYFRDLEDVLDSLLTHTFEQLALTPGQVDMEELRRNYVFWVEHRELLDALYQGGQLEKLFEYALRFTGDFQTDDPDASLRRDRGVFIIGGFMSLMISWYVEGFRKTPENMARIAYGMLYEPFLKNQ